MADYLDMHRYLQDIAIKIYKGVQSVLGQGEVVGRASDGDLHFKLDERAERNMEQALETIRSRGIKLAYISEKEGRVIKKDQDPEILIVIDPIDGSRPAKCGFPLWCVNSAAAPYKENATLADIQWSLMKSANGDEIYAEKGKGIVQSDANGNPISHQPSKVTTLEDASLILEVCGNEQTLAGLIYAPLIAKTWPRGVFVVSSSSWSLSQMIAGKIDGYMHVAKRIYEEFPEQRKKIAEESGGKLKGLFSYDIAPWLLAGKEAGLTITDSYGKSLDAMKLADISPENQRCVIAASTPQLHQILVKEINERITWIKKKKRRIDELL